MGKYDDIINLPHHVSDRHPQMPVSERAAQFSSFKALSGFEEEIAETTRVTDSRIELSEEELSVLNEKFQKIMQKDHPKVKVTVFIPDLFKAGGRYETMTGTVKRIDRIERLLFFTDRTTVNIDNITDIEEIREDSNAD